MIQKKILGRTLSLGKVVLKYMHENTTPKNIQIAISKLDKMTYTYLIIQEKSSRKVIFFSFK